LNDACGTGSTSCANAPVNHIPAASIELITASPPALRNLIGVVFIVSSLF
jgi:hypothetical protein